MHCIFLNCGPKFISHLIGTFFKDLAEPPPYQIDSKKWEELGAKMESLSKYFPTKDGRTTRNIEKHFAGFKAEEWSKFMLQLSTVLLENAGLHRKYLEPYAKWIKAIQLCSKAAELTPTDLDDIRSGFHGFINFYERYNV